MVRLSCPACEMPVVATDGQAVCPSCGRIVTRSETFTPVSSNAPDEQLVVDVREAFGSSALGWDGDEETWLGLWRVHGVPWGERAAPCVVPPGSRLDDFEICGEVGRGGMGIVYRARQISLNRLVALKVLPPALQRRSSTLQRFRREALAVARLKHPNIVPVYAQGEHHGYLYYAMELIDGVGLDEAIHSRPEMLSSEFDTGRSKRMPTDKAGRRHGTAAREPVPLRPWMSAPPSRTSEDFRYIARLVAGAADGLGHAAEHGVVHRDIKPQNLLLGTDGQLHITDFGLALLQDEPHLTMGGELMGTAAYLAPEQLGTKGAQIDLRTDVYALGATLYEMLAGRRPFDGDSRNEILSKIKVAEPPRPRSIDLRIPRDLETICLKAMAKEPAHRYSTARLMAEDLRCFAYDRPIAGRRPGPVEIGLRYLRRRRATAVAGLTATVTLLLALAWMFNADLHRREDADRILRAAYERLAFIDYRMPDLVEESVQRAEKLGADPIELNTTRALVDLGKQENASAILRLRQVIAQRPDDRRALYLLAWAQWRNGDRGASQLALEQAESLGGPDSADAWFFRGLAVHFDRPAVAMECYRNAIALKAADHEFYPQAVLHLARAQNQEMYVNRKLTTFAEADSGLRQLIDHKHYGAYPYYLLSITHRLAGEILTAEAGWIGEAAEFHLRWALQWAQSGQQVDPSDNRVVTAEAECLESMGNYHEAIAARTRAIVLANRRHEEWEAYHYRWRLYYWTDQFAEALADLDACLGFSPGSRYYAFVYPALVYDRMGDWQRAVELGRTLFPEGSTNGLAAIWSATTLRLLGQTAEAQALLRSVRASVDLSGTDPPQTEAWLNALFAFCVGEQRLEDLLLVAREAGSARGLIAEAYFHAGAKALAEGDADQALGHFGNSYRTYDGEQAYTFHAKTIWQVMQQDPLWPLWLTSGQGQPGGKGRE